MAKNTNPLTKNIQIKQSWSTIGLPVTGRVKQGSNELMKENFIKDLINGSFMKLGLLTSEVGISKNCVGDNIVYWQYYPLNERGVLGVRGNGVKVIKLIQVIKSLIELKEPTKSYKMVCIRAANKFVEGKILNDYINNMVIEDPSKLKYVVSTVIREYKMWSQGLKLKKHDSIINKGKNNR